MTTASRGGAARPHVLYVAWGFPPMAAGGTFRTLATANMLVETGFDVTVLTTTREGFLGLTGVDDALVDRIDERIAVERVPFDNPTLDWDIRQWPKERAQDPAGWVARRAEQAPDFPEPVFGDWYRPLLSAAERVHARRPVDLVVGSANPHVVMSAGHHLHELHGVPYVIDHRDAWRLNCYLGTESYADNPKVAQLETAYMMNAHEIWFVNEAILRWHQELYPAAAGRMRVVENGFDRDFAPTPQLDPPRLDRPLTFGYVGSLSARAPVEEFIEGWIDARRRSPLLSDAVALLYGPLIGGGAGRRHLVAAAEKYGVVYRGPVGKDEVAAVYEQSDALLLILAGGRYVTSGKVYEYLSSALPIVSVHDPENGAKEVLSGYPLWFGNDDLTPQGIGDALIAAATAAREAGSDVRNSCREFAEDAERRSRLRQPIRDLYDAVAARREVSA